MSALGKLKSRIVLHARRRLVIADQSYRGYFTHRCLFVHVPKTAGKAVTLGLFGHNIGPHLTLGEVRDIFARVYGVRDLDTWFTFGFVRNPWDRCYSAWRYLSTGGGTPGDAAFAERAVAPYGGFNEFVRGWLAERGPRQIHFRPQSEFLCDETGEIGVRFVGRFERIAEDYERVRAELRGPTRPLPEVNRSKLKGDYRAAYDDTSAELVGRIYADDARLFGYCFDPSDDDASEA
ncbi:MAG: sulfotransferase family 2 domain-containing protein [Phycisphaerales bacterium]